MVNPTIKNGMAMEKRGCFSTMTLSIKGFKNMAITASSDPTGIVNNTPSRARPQYGFTKGHIRL